MKEALGMGSGEIGFVIVGLGVGRSRAKAVVETPGAKLVAVCDLDAEKASKAAKDFGCEWTTDYRAMLVRDDVDVIGAFTPSGSHGTVVIDALKAGKHAVTTKPMDVTLARVDAMIEAARKANRLLAVDFATRYETPARQLRRAIQDGIFGRMLFGDARLKWHREQRYYDAGGWRGTWAMDGGGSLMNQGVHCVDALLWLMGPVERVEYARSAILTHKIETEDATEAVITFRDGAWGVIQTTTTHYPSQPNVIEVHGDRGSAVLQRKLDTTWKVLDESGAEREYVPPEDLGAPANVAEDVVSALTKGTSVACDGIDGRRSLALIAAIYEAARSGKSVALEG